MQATPPKDRREALTDAWELMSVAILRVLRSKKPSAAELECARKYLADNKTTLQQIQQWKAATPSGLAPGQTLPVFNDPAEQSEPETTAAESADVQALLNPPPFSPQ